MAWKGQVFTHLRQPTQALMLTRAMAGSDSSISLEKRARPCLPRHSPVRLRRGYPSDPGPRRPGTHRPCWSRQAGASGGFRRRSRWCRKRCGASRRAGPRRARPLLPLPAPRDRPRPPPAFRGAYPRPCTTIFLPFGVDAGDTAPDVLDAVLLLGPAGELVVALTRGADIHVEDVGLGVRDVVLCEDRLFGDVHAAEVRAVGDAHRFVARARAGNKDDGLRLRLVGRPQDMAGGRSRCVEEPLVLDARDHVRIAASAVLGKLLDVHKAVAGGYDDGAHLFRYRSRPASRSRSRRWGRPSRRRRTCPFSELAAVAGVDRRLLRDGLGEGDVDGLRRRHAEVEVVIRVLRRALLHALAAARALGPVDIGGSSCGSSPDSCPRSP